MATNGAVQPLRGRDLDGASAISAISLLIMACPKALKSCAATTQFPVCRPIIVEFGRTLPFFVRRRRAGCGHQGEPAFRLTWYFDDCSIIE
jgi:hypothetical protein